jgi:hypothetical protein
MILEIKGDSVENSGMAGIRPENFVSCHDLIIAAGVLFIWCKLSRNILLTYRNTSFLFWATQPLLECFKLRAL